MANTITYGPNVITIAPDGSAAWDAATDTFLNSPSGLLVEVVKFFPNAANDTCLLRAGSDSGPIVSKMKDVAGSGTADSHFGTTPIKLHLKGSEGVSGSLIMIFYRG
jgi:hypothetical protein